MPFKKGKSPADATSKYATIVGSLTQRATKEAVTKAIAYASGASKEIAPIEFGTLINSQFRRIEQKGNGWRGVLGYAVNYAVYLESPKPGGRMDNWQPRPPEQKIGNAWNPISGQGFLRLAFTGIESGPIIQQILRDGIKLR